ncbi:MAG TPA: head GIN domain-containing protein [Kofleriaceae bacterium]
MRIVAIVLVAVGCNATGVQGSGKAAHDVRQVPPFDAITVGGALDVEVDVGSAQQVTIDGDDNLVPLVHSEVSGHILKLWTERSFHAKVPVIAHIAMPSFAGIDLSGAGHVRVQNISGGALALTVSGAGKLTAAGSAHDATIELSGAGAIDAEALHLDRATVKLGGAGNVDVFASQALSAEISGTGHIRCDGHPAQIDKKVSGVGSLEVR